MSSWLIFALITPFIWAFSNIVDRIFAERIVGDERILTFMSALIRLPYALILFALSGFFVPEFHLIVRAMLVGLLNIFPFVFYYRALKTEDAYTVILTYVVTHPIAIVVMTTLWLGEVMIPQEIIGGLILIFAAVLSIIQLGKKIQVRWGVLWSILSAILWSLGDVVWGISIPLYPSLTVFMTWFMFGSAVLAGLYLCVPGFSRTLIPMYKKVTWKWLTLFTLTVGVVVASYFTYSKALVLERISITAFIITVQPLFVFLMTFIAARMKLNSDFEKTTTKEYILKISAFVIAATGIVLISVPL